MELSWPKWCAQTLHPFSQIFKFFPGICAAIVAPPSGDFHICPIRWKGLFFREKNCKQHLTDSTIADAVSLKKVSFTYGNRRLTTP